MGMHRPRKVKDPVARLAQVTAQPAAEHGSRGAIVVVTAQPRLLNDACYGYTLGKVGSEELQRGEGQPDGVVRQEHGMHPRILDGGEGSSSGQDR
jgi:hypothetical protein